MHPYGYKFIFNHPYYTRQGHMALLFIRQQGNGRSEMPTSCPEGVFPGEVSAEEDAPRGKRLSYSLRPVLEDATVEKEKNHGRRHREGRLLVFPFCLLPVPSCCLRPTPCLPKLVAITLLQHPLDIRGAVKNLAAQLDVGNPSLIAVILQTPPADLQPL